MTIFTEKNLEFWEEDDLRKSLPLTLPKIAGISLAPFFSDWSESGVARSSFLCVFSLSTGHLTHKPKKGPSKQFSSSPPSHFSLSL